MSEIRPYELSPEYYEMICKVTPQIEKRMDKELRRYANDYRSFVKRKRWETPRSLMEYELELVMYAAMSNHYDEIVGYEMDWEELIDVVSAEPEYQEEYARLKNWGAFWEEKDQPGLEDALARTMKEIRDMGKKYLLTYLASAQEFQQKMMEQGTDRKDYCLVSRGLEMYYVNMFGSEIMNRMYAEEFAKTKERYIFLPGCMAIQGEACVAKKDKVGFACAQCTKECAIARITEATKQDGACTRIMYHESQITASMGKQQSRVGIIGIACVLNLLSGGWKAKRLGYVPQCVLLDYPGCKKHWDRQGEGIVTRTCESQIKKKLS